VTKSEERVFVAAQGIRSCCRKFDRAVLLVRIRDEAQSIRDYLHRELRRRARLRSVLDDIEGVGPVRRRALLPISEASTDREDPDENPAVKDSTVNSPPRFAGHLDEMTALLDVEESRGRGRSDPLPLE